MTKNLIPLASLRIHISSFHVVHSSSQTEEKETVEKISAFTINKFCQTAEENYELKIKFETYSCFYCDKKIESMLSVVTKPWKGTPLPNSVGQLTNNISIFELVFE